jgi:hypothetical protein
MISEKILGAAKPQPKLGKKKRRREPANHANHTTRPLAAGKLEIRSTKSETKRKNEENKKKTSMEFREIAR